MQFLLAVAVLCAAGVAFASIDLSDFDTEAMNAMEDASQELESAIGARDAQVAIANAEFVRESLQWAEGYFARKPDVEEAVRLARQGQEFAAAITTSANASDFQAASEAYASLLRTCKRCHDVYKPPSL